MTTRTLWIDWSRLAGQPRTEQCRALRHVATVSTGHVWSEHFDVDIDIEVLESRKPRQKRSTLDLRKIQDLALDAVIGPIVARPARVVSLQVTKQWATDGPGVLITIRTHRPKGEST